MNCHQLVTKDSEKPALIRESAASGLMTGYRWPIPPPDRRAIVADVRELERKHLASATGAPAGSD